MYEVARSIVLVFLGSSLCFVIWPLAMRKHKLTYGVVVTSHLVSALICSVVAGVMYSYLRYLGVENDALSAVADDAPLSLAAALSAWLVVASLIGFIMALRHREKGRTPTTASMHDGRRGNS